MRSIFPPRSAISENSVLEASVACIQARKEGSLKNMERKLVLHLLLDEADDKTPAVNAKIFAEILLRESIEADISRDAKCLSLNFIVPTSNICERLFYVAEYSLSDHRKSMLPTKMEMQLFLSINARF